jgi:hypothetical protein
VPELAKVSCPHLERLMAHERHAFEATPKCFVHDIAKDAAGSPSVGLEHFHDVIVERQDHSHSRILVELR